METAMLKSQRGQAVTETILLTWILLAFVAAAFQVFLANESIFRSMTAVHQQLFQRAFDRNLGKDCGGCMNSQADVEVVWARSDFPEVRVPVLALFQRFGAPSELVLRRLDSLGGGDKRTVVKAGTDP